MYEQYIRDFLHNMFPLGDVPLWTVDALAHADINITSTLVRGETGQGVSVEPHDGDADKLDSLS